MLKENKILKVGVIVLVATIVLRQMVELPDLIHGVGIGVAVVCELVGLYQVARKDKKLN